jgi:hypothetical protein
MIPGGSFPKELAKTQHGSSLLCDVFATSKGKNVGELIRRSSALAEVGIATLTVVCCRVA